MSRFFLKGALFASLLFGTVSADTIYVNVNSLNTIQDGNSWKTAFVSLQDALDKANIIGGHNDVWVAQGAYFPSKVYSPDGIAGGAYGINTPNLMTFNLPNNISIFGGFNGTEKKREERNPSKNTTVLSGAGTSWHVVTLGNDIEQTGVKAKLDGLHIVKGNAQGPTGTSTLFTSFTYDHASGAGVYVTFGSKLKVKDVLFAGGVAESEGGALFSNNSNVHVKHSRFIGNSAGLEGGAIEILNTYENCAHFAKIESSFFKGNSAGSFGGAIVIEGTIQNPNSSAEIRDCEFKHNFSAEGGAVVVDSLKVSCIKSIFKKNVALFAGGAFATTNVVNTIATANNSLPFTPFTTTMSECVFDRNRCEGNQAAHDALFGGAGASGLDFPFGGGAIAVYVNGYLDVKKSKFFNNEAQNSAGGAILNGFAAGENIINSGGNGFVVETNVEECIFKGNKSPTNNGGAIASLPNTTTFPDLPIDVYSTLLSVKESNFDANIAGLNGGAIYLDFSTAELKKNHYEHNKAAEGNAIYGLDSIVNGDSDSPFIKNN